MHRSGILRGDVRRDILRPLHAPTIRPRRAFRPDGSGIGRLEDRTLLSSGVSAGLVHRSVESLKTARGEEGRRVDVQMDVTYPTLSGPGEQLNIYSPTGAAPAGGWPVIVAIHGGGWRRLDDTGYGDRIASAFVPQGYVVIAPNYELSTPRQPSWPTNLDDVRSAVAWVRSEAPELGIDPGEVVAMGESAGGNLAELLGTDPGPAIRGESTQVQAVIAFSGPSDLNALYAESYWAGRAAAQFLGGTPQQVPANYAAASPVDHVQPGDPPMLLVHGIEDPLVPAAQSQEMAAALTEADVSNQLILVPGGHDLDFPDHYGDLTPRLLEFLEATWKDEGSLSSP